MHRMILKLERRILATKAVKSHIRTTSIGCLPRTPDIDGLVANLFASRQMVSKYDQLRAQNKITNEEAALSSVRETRSPSVSIPASRKGNRGIQELARACSAESIATAPALGKTHEEIVKKFLDKAVPELYPKLEMGSRNLKGKEAEEMLKAANLNGLSAVFYERRGGLGLVDSERWPLRAQSQCDVAKEVLDYLKGEHEYGNKVTGKGQSTDNFQGIGLRLGP